MKLELFKRGYWQYLNPLSPGGDTLFCGIQTRRGHCRVGIVSLPRYSYSKCFIKYSFYQDKGWIIERHFHIQILWFAYAWKKEIKITP